MKTTRRTSSLAQSLLSSFDIAVKIFIGNPVQAQANRLGVDVAEFDGFRNAAASLDGFGVIKG